MGISIGLGQIQFDAGLPTDAEAYLKNVNFCMVEVVYEWANGVPFSQIALITTIQEGSIVRVMTRLDELCREIRNSARVIGNPTLYRKLEQASEMIKRDIVFASSLYVS